MTFDPGAFLAPVVDWLNASFHPLFAAISHLVEAVLGGIEALLLAPPPAFEYVLVHELCHLLHADHSRRFWREVERRFPDWRDERSYFNREGRALKTRLRTLLAG